MNFYDLPKFKPALYELAIGQINQENETRRNPFIVQDAKGNLFHFFYFKGHWVCTVHSKGSSEVIVTFTNEGNIQEILQRPKKKVNKAGLQGCKGRKPTRLLSSTPSTSSPRLLRLHSGQVRSGQAGQAGSLQVGSTDLPACSAQAGSLQVKTEKNK